MPDLYRITTVTEAADSFDLTTLIDAKADLNLDDSDPATDIFIKRLIRQVSAAISQYCNRVFALQSYQDLLRPLVGTWPTPAIDYTAPLLVAKSPLVEVTEVSVDDVVLVEDTDYEVDLEKGQIWRLDGDGNQIGWAALKTTVKYAAGWTLPALSTGANKLLDTASDLEGVAIAMVKARYMAKDRDPALTGVSQPNLGDRRYWVGGVPGQDSAFPPEYQAILDNYRMPVMG